MTRIEIRPEQIFQAVIAGTQDVSIAMKVQIVTGDGRVIISPERSRKAAIITTPEVLLNGGVVDAGGRLGTLIFHPQIGGNIDTRE